MSHTGVRVLAQVAHSGTLFARFRAAIEQADDELRQAIERALQEREGRRPPEKAERPPTELVGVGVGSPTTSCEVVGWSQEAMVELVGLEPTTSSVPR